MEAVTRVRDWVLHCFHSFNSIVADPRFLPAVFFALMILSAIGVILLLVWFIGRGSRARDTYHPDAPNYLFFDHGNVKFFGSEGERVVAVSGSTIEACRFKDGEKCRLEIKIAGQALPKVKYVPATIRVRRLSKYFKDNQVQISNSAINEFGVEIGEDDILHVRLKKLVAFENIWARTFGDPDQNVRLAWLLSFWSLIASTIAGVIVGHLHL